MDNKAVKHFYSHSNGESGYHSISPYFRDGDREVIARFFKEHRHIKRCDFYRDAIIDAIQRCAAKTDEKAAIAAGRTQIDPSLVRGASR